MHDHQDEDTGTAHNSLTSTHLEMPDTDGQSPASAHPDRRTSSDAHAKKKRKVNHACIYCRRSHMTCDSDRPCQRCIKRNIGHLCHDEPRESPGKKSRGGDTDSTHADDATSPKQEYDGLARMSTSSTTNSNGPSLLGGSNLDVRPSSSENIPGSTSQPVSMGNNAQPAPGFSFNDQLLQQSRFQDISSFHPNYMFNANEINDEYNLFNDFLSTSLFDETGMYSAEDMTAYNDPSFTNSMNVSLTNGNGDFALPSLTSNHNSATQQHPAVQGPFISRPASAKPISDKAREKYYMTAADPAGTDPPEERMNKLLKAKYDAGLLKPFNYVNGYARLNKYMEKHMRQSSRHKILMQLDRFRPKFRERMQSLTDIELVLVEMWFERSLMEYDRVFASMAIPACCWRRTGEIFRGNKEMAELIHVPIESLRDGKLAIHDFIVEDQLVSYWEKFCAICFDQQQKAMLTSCTLKSPNSSADQSDIPCCFSFTIKRDNHNIPSLIVGNFLPITPVKH